MSATILRWLPNSCIVLDFFLIGFWTKNDYTEHHVFVDKLVFDMVEQSLQVLKFRE